MKKQDIQKKYDNKKKLLLKYNHHYFNLDSPLVTDSKYDQIKSDIIEIARQHTKRKEESIAKTLVNSLIIPELSVTLT